MTLPQLIGKSQQVLIKPCNSLVESLLLGKLLDLDRHIATDGKAMLHARFSKSFTFIQ